MKVGDYVIFTGGDQYHWWSHFWWWLMRRLYTGCVIQKLSDEEHLVLQDNTNRIDCVHCWDSSVMHKLGFSQYVADWIEQTGMAWKSGMSQDEHRHWKQLVLELQMNNALWLWRPQ